MYESAKMQNRCYSSSHNHYCMSSATVKINGFVSSLIGTFYINYGYKIHFNCVLVQVERVYSL